MVQILRQIARKALPKARLHRTRPLTTCLHPTPPHRASPSLYVSGVTPEQIASNPALAEWYAANFESYQTDPDVRLVPEPEEEVVVEEVDEHAIVLPPELVARNIRPLVAYVRIPGAEEGTRNCRRMRNPFQTNLPGHDYFPLIPGIVHGSDPTKGILSISPLSKLLIKTPWFEIQRELDRYHRSFESRVYALTIYEADGCHVNYHRSKQNIPEPEYKVCQESMTITEIPPPPPAEMPIRKPLIENMLVLPADLQMHPVEHSAFSLNFIRYHPAKPIKIPMKTINEEEAPAMKRGGFIAFANRHIECLVDPSAPIPEFIAVECTGLRQKEVVRRDRCILPEGVTVHPRVGEDYLVGTVFGAKGSGDVEEEEKKK